MSNNKLRIYFENFGLTKMREDISLFNTKLAKKSYRKRIIKRLNRIMIHEYNHYLINRKFHIISEISICYESKNYDDYLYFNINGSCKNNRVNSLLIRYIVNLFHFLFDFVYDLLRLRILNIPKRIWDEI